MTPMGRANKAFQTVHNPQTKEKLSNQLSFPQQGNHNARPDPLNTKIKQRTEQNTSLKHAYIYFDPFKDRIFKPGDLVPGIDNILPI